MFGLMFLGKLWEFINPSKTGKQRRSWLDAKYLSQETLENFSYHSPTSTTTVICCLSCFFLLENKQTELRLYRTLHQMVKSLIRTLLYTASTFTIFKFI